MSEARRNAGRNMRGSDVAHALNAPTRPFPRDDRPAGESGANRKKDFARDNRKHIKEIQKQVKQRKQAEEEQKAKPMFRMKKFSNAAAKVSREGSIAEESNEADGKRHEFLRKGARSMDREKGEADPLGWDRKNSPRDRIKPRVPVHTDLTSLAPRAKTNFVSRNAKKMSGAVPEKIERVHEPAMSEKPGFGRVPLYIHRRKVELAAKEAIKQQERAREKLPAGMTLMSEEERKQTVELLTQNQAKIVKDISDMPLTIESPTMVERHNMLHEKLKEVEDALKLFSRKKVYITA